jgi:ferredoxin
LVDFGVDGCIIGHTFIGSIATLSDGSDDVEFCVDYYDPAQREHIQVVVDDELRVCHEEEVVHEESSLTKQVDPPFGNIMLELAMCLVDYRMCYMCNNCILLVFWIVVLKVQCTKNCSDQQTQMSYQFYPFGSSSGLFFLDTFIADKLNEGVSYRSGQNESG